MSNWKKVKLSEIMSPCSDSEYIIDVQNEHYITLSLYGKGAHERQIKDGKYPVPFLGYRVRSGQFIYSRIDARNGAYDIIGQELDGFVVSKDFPVYDIDTEIVLPRYLLRSVLSTGFINQVKHSSFGATNRMRIKEDVFANYSIMLPPKDQQQTIVAILDQVSAIIENRQQQLSTLDDLIKARFVEMFGDPVSNPKSWEKRSLSDEAEIRIGPFGSLLHKEDYITGGHALINPSHIIDGKITPDNNLTISDEKYTELSAYHLLEGDVVMGRRGEMGRCAVVKQPGLLCGTGSLLIRSNGDLTADYIQKIISFPSFKRTIEDMAVGQTMPNLNVPIVSAFQIIKPPKSVQDHYYSFVAQIDKSKSVIQKALDETQFLFDSLMQQYFG